MAFLGDVTKKRQPMAAFLIPTSVAAVTVASVLEFNSYHAVPLRPLFSSAPSVSTILT